MRILMVSSLYPPIVQGGAEKAASLLAEALVRAGDEVTVVSLTPGREETVEERNGVRIYRVPLDNLYWPFHSSAARPSASRRVLWHLKDAWNFKAARRFGAILEVERPDVMHSHAIVGFSISIWREAKRRGIRIVHTTHDYYLLCLRSDMHPGGMNCGGECMHCSIGTKGRRYWSNRIDEAIAVSPFVLERHRARGYFEGVAASACYNIASPLDLAACSLPSSRSGELVFGFIGRLEEQKGIQVLLAATGLLTGSNWRLRIAGSGRADFIAALRETYRDDRIEWLGYADASAFYASVDVVVVPSVWEDPLPYTAFEALQAGKALLGARSGGIPEIAALGKVAEICSPDDPAALAQIMDGALNDSARWQRGGFADRNAAEFLSSSAIVAQHQARYRGLGSGKVLRLRSGTAFDGNSQIPESGLGAGLIDAPSSSLPEGHHNCS